METSDYIYSLFSDNAYSGNDNDLNILNWQKFKTSDDYGVSNDGYYGKCYINHNTQEILFTFAGAVL